jgi:3-oxoacyl-[acyl-carrier protein] reductase
MESKQVALVTGAVRGLGHCILRALHETGYRVVASDRDEASAHEVAATLDPTGRSAFGLKLDVADATDFRPGLDAVLERWGGLHVVVNNAAITLGTPVMQITPEEFDRVVSTNLRGTFLSCQTFGAHMANAGYGRIVNVASLAGQNGGTASGAHYASSKAGILVLTKIFARELAAGGVTVNAIAPGPLDLPSVREMVPPERLAKLVEQIPVKQLGSPEFVASVVLQLVSKEAGFTTGAAWDINGGIYMR